MPMKIAYAGLSLAALTAAGAGLAADRLAAEFLGSAAASRARAADAAALRSLVSAVRDAESGQRGYLLTGDRAYLRPYHRAGGALRGALASVRAAGRSNRWPSGEAALVAAGAEAKAAELARTVALADAGRRAEAVAVLKSGEGRRIMERLVDRSDALLAAAARAEGARAEALRSRARALRAVLPVAYALAGLVGAGALALGVRNQREKAAADARCLLERDRAARAADRARDDAARAARDAEHARHLLNAMSHDLRTPMSAVAANASVALLLLGREHRAAAAGPGEDPGELRSSIEAVRVGAFNLKALLDRFLDAARAGDEPTVAERFDLAAALREAAAPVRPAAAARGVRVDVACSPPAAWVTTDRGALVRIARNLADNAVKFSPEGRGEDVTVAGRADGRGGCVLTVSDHGPGIEPHVMGRLFREFEQGGNPERDPAKGFGLGLSIVSRLVTRLGGTVTADSQPGRGATFRVTLPPLPVTQGQGVGREHDSRKE